MNLSLRRISLITLTAITWCTVAYFRWWDIGFQITTGFILGWTTGCIGMMYFLRLEDKPLTFVKHIQDHLGEDEQVMCKICDKTIDEIYEESQKGEKK